jgi:hypothetical protein
MALQGDCAARTCSQISIRNFSGEVSSTLPESRAFYHLPRGRETSRRIRPLVCASRRRLVLGLDHPSKLISCEQMITKRIQVAIGLSNDYLPPKLTALLRSDRSQHQLRRGKQPESNQRTGSAGRRGLIKLDGFFPGAHGHLCPIHTLCCAALDGSSTDGGLEMDDIRTWGNSGRSALFPASALNHLPLTQQATDSPHEQATLPTQIQERKSIWAPAEGVNLLGSDSDSLGVLILKRAQQALSPTLVAAALILVGYANPRLARAVTMELPGTSTRWQVSTGFDFMSFCLLSAESISRIRWLSRDRTKCA